MFVAARLGLLDQVKGIYQISEQECSWTRSCMGHNIMGDVIHDPFAPPLSSEVLDEYHPHVVLIG